MLLKWHILAVLNQCDNYNDCIMDENTYNGQAACKGDNFASLCDKLLAQNPRTMQSISLELFTLMVRCRHTR